MQQLPTPMSACHAGPEDDTVPADLDAVASKHDAKFALV